MRSFDIKVLGELSTFSIEFISLFLALVPCRANSMCKFNVIQWTGECSPRWRVSISYWLSFIEGILCWTSATLAINFPTFAALIWSSTEFKLEFGVSTIPPYLHILGIVITKINVSCDAHGWLKSQRNRRLIVSHFYHASILFRSESFSL